MSYAPRQLELPRHGKGRENFASFLDRWIVQSTLSNGQVCRLANNMLGSKRLHGQQLSGLRHGLCKQISIYTFDAIGTLATAVWERHNKNQDFAGDDRNELELLPPFGDKHGAYAMAEIAEMFIGTRPCPELPDVWLGVTWGEKEEAVSVGSLDLGRTVRAIITKDGGDLIDRVDQLLSHYPTNDEKRQMMMRQVICGMTTLSKEQIDKEAMAVCIALQSFTAENWDLARLSRLASSTQI